MHCHRFVFWHGVRVRFKSNKMEFKTRTTHSFIEINVDEDETTLFRSHPNEIKQMINNLLDLLDDLASYTDKSVAEYVSERDT